MLVAGVAGASAQPQASSLQVIVEGAVQAPGPQDFAPDARYATAVLAARPTADAYVLGAALLRREALVLQRRLKAGIEHDLQQLALNEATAGFANQLASVVDAMPVTGRVTALLDPRPLELSTAHNRLLADGDRFIYPRRPTTVQVMGAVGNTCVLAHKPLQQARDYLRHCNVLPLADRDWLYVIQPDGNVQRIGIALWNRGQELAALAPGATLYVPLAAKWLGEVDAGFNAQLASFIATQPLPVGQP
ncbi:capsule biosynthesis GfcC family protein [Stenotrophomonas sp. YIM B06876]|uniref:capsule biosynthesis GfcC family protein n=1 Tax=Stenotrophomonas sp. YIM B06876 TaxID=3060211 RepID=UPI002738F2B7|nr:capsule biosynthesis GfcC family protein [Stenotrophomonas sp. YIM B06876]